MTLVFCAIKNIYLDLFLFTTGKLSNNQNDFKNLLQQIWFDMYSRGTRKVSSSGFEHVFVAEVKNSQVSGLHNWLYFKAEEDKRNADYLGYMKVLSFGEVPINIKTLSIDLIINCI